MINLEKNARGDVRLVNYLGVKLSMGMGPNLGQKMVDIIIEVGNHVHQPFLRRFSNKHPSHRLTIMVGSVKIMAGHQSACTYHQKVDKNTNPGFKLMPTSTGYRLSWANVG